MIGTSAGAVARISERIMDWPASVTTIGGAGRTGSGDAGLCAHAAAIVMPPIADATATSAAPRALFFTLRPDFALLFTLVPICIRGFPILFFRRAIT